MIRRDHDLPLKRQAQLLGISRGSVYYLPRAVSPADLAMMRQIDELHLEYPFAGARMLRDMLRAQGFEVGRKHVATLMKRMGVEALYRRPNTSRKHPQNPIFPYLLRGQTIDRANHVWAMDITYIPMARGFVYLAVVPDVIELQLAHVERNRVRGAYNRAQHWPERIAMMRWWADHSTSCAFEGNHAL